MVRLPELNSLCMFVHISYIFLYYLCNSCAKKAQDRHFGTLLAITPPQPISLSVLIAWILTPPAAGQHVVDLCWVSMGPSIFTKLPKPPPETLILGRNMEEIPPHHGISMCLGYASWWRNSVEVDSMEISTCHCDGCWWMHWCTRIRKEYQINVVSVTGQVWSERPGSISHCPLTCDVSCFG